MFKNGGFGLVANNFFIYARAIWSFHILSSENSLSGNRPIYIDINIYTDNILILYLRLYTDPGDIKGYMIYDFLYVAHVFIN